MAKPNILLLDDDKIVTTYLTQKLKPDYNIHSFSKTSDAINFLKNNIVDVALLDVDLGQSITGIDTLREMIKIDSKLSAIMISSIKNIQNVVASIKGGAIDFIEKPINIDTLHFRISQIIKFKKLSKTQERYERIIEKENLSNLIIGESEIINNCKKKIEAAGPMRLLLLGETGVGKTPFARYSNIILSKEYDENRAFEQINCACLKRDRFVDELFGHIKGAYTGAGTDKLGLVEVAKDGDLFLDEIGDLDHECQGELLTYLDNYEYYKLGGTKKNKSKIRLICATNLDLQDMVSKGLFRKDLYSRISQCVIKIPPLRERKDDIEHLVNHFLKLENVEHKHIQENVIPHLKNFDWEEGNIRTLKNVCEFMAISSRRCDHIGIEHLPEDYSLTDKNTMGDLKNTYDIKDLFDIGYEKYLEKFEFSILKKLLQEEASKSKLAERIKLNRMTLSRKLTKLGLK